ncbi:hypothetical protein F443_05271 [Plasmopara halstedii]|uniref:EF-hand domain-containing protein n=1 Tax=Plasmopara halstedii TaxID=4781 RepID=A0A0P1AVE7_PLAHL|nr:hypothetical protein F443_05271 [Plasmopara halstedii]CEG46389.1 hypothetical protein F443_05271 [Plasmopara halstedii]|eukprot:XP_024582758.1 hypothetical protein F443_05271 [Plasmopara halstedii]
MDSKRRLTQAKVLPPVNRPPLLSTSHSDIDIGRDNHRIAEHNVDRPRVKRHTASLPDLRPPFTNNLFEKQSSISDDNKDKSSKGGGSAATRNSLPMVPKFNNSQEIGNSLPTNIQRKPTRRRANDIILTRPATIAVVIKYQLGQYELKKFKTCFKHIDLDSSGVIDCEEFFEFIDETKTPFSEGLFRMIDADNNGTIDFEEFVHATVLYCMYTRDEILRFAFNTFDPTASGSIGDKELRRLVSMVNDGQSQFPSNINNALIEFDRNKAGVIDFDEFKKLNKRFPMLLFPCFRLQDRMQKATLGDNHWLQLHKFLYERLKDENYQVCENTTVRFQSSP